MKCPNCGADIKGDFCDYCGSEMPKKPAPTIINNIIIQNNSSSYVIESDRSKTMALILCVLGGYFGLHMFYVRKPGLGVLYLFTFGLFMLGWWIDIIKIISGSFVDSEGRTLKGGTMTPKAKRDVFLGFTVFWLFCTIVQLSLESMEGLVFYGVLTIIFGILWYKNRLD